MAARPDRHATVVVFPPGLEELVADELAALGVRSRPAGTGARAARMTDRQLYLANVALRCATRVLVDVGRIEARSFAALVERSRQLEVGAFLVPGEPTRVRVSTHRCRLSHTGGIEERLRAALALGPPPSDPAAPAALVVVRGDRDAFDVRVDSSGAPLHARGWRGPAGKAPLRESIAAAALAASGWRPDQPLVDPFCGSGTLVIEAARRAAGLAPGAGRGFAFADWPSFAPGTWASVRAEVEAAAGDAAPVARVGRDRDDGAIAAAADNAERASVADLVDLAAAPVSALERPDGPPGWIVTNPPWGRRVGGAGDLRDLYARFGQVCRERFDGWGVALLVADERLAGHAGLRAEPRLRTRAGPTPVTLLVAEAR